MKMKFQEFAAYAALIVLGTLAIGVIHPDPPAALAQINATKSLPSFDVKAEGRAVVHVLAANDDGETVAESVTAPLFAFRVESGSVSGTAILDCRQQTEDREKDSITYPVVALQCGNVKLVLVGVDLTVKK